MTTHAARSFDAQVIGAFGRRVRVRDAAGEQFMARPAGRRLDIVCGDRVRCEHDAVHGETHVLDVLPRGSALYRSSARGGSETVLANLTLLVVVIAPRPAPDWFVVDRYLAAASSAGTAALIVLNKSDLGIEPGLRAELAAYSAAGYRHIVCSARDALGLAGLLAALAGETAALVGQSGVGKSSLVHALVPETAIATSELDRDDEGRHTTTASMLYDIAGNGQLIDSPGVRDFAPAIDRLEPASLGFPDIDRLAPQCRFHDCQHLQEPKCAVQSAAAAHTLHPRRYESYRRLRRLYAELRAAQGPKHRPPA
jgi:ribosome biogenesis GTPase